MAGHPARHPANPHNPVFQKTRNAGQLLVSGLYIRPAANVNSLRKRKRIHALYALYPFLFNLQNVHKHAAV